MNVVKTLTISIAAYNVQDYIGKTLESLLKCKNASDLDVIVVNDGSSDETLRVAREFERLAPTIIRIVNKQNGGYGSTINTSIRLAQGVYYRLLDGDDWVDPVELDKLLVFLRECNADLVVTKYRTVYESTSTVQSLDWPYDGNALPIEDRLDYSFAMHMLTFKTAAIRSCIIEHPITEHANYTDTEFVLKTVSAVGTAALFDADVYQYRMGREGQSVSLESWLTNIGTACKISLVLAQYYEDNIAHTANISQEVKRWALRQCIGSSVNKCRLYMRRGMGRKEYEEMTKFLNTLKLESSEVYVETLACFPFVRRGKHSYMSFIINAAPLRLKTIMRRLMQD